MEHYGVSVQVKNSPVLDPEFIPLMKFNHAFLADAKKPVSIAVERADSQMATFHTYIHGAPEMEKADNYYIERLVKTILWMKGGFRIYVAGDKKIYNYLRSVYCAGGQQEFDWDYMANVFERPFEILLVDKVPESKDLPKRVGGHLEGCRIGFDAGGSDRKVSAVIDGETVAEVLDYVQFSPKQLVRNVETWVSESIRNGKITADEGYEFVRNYRSGLYGYTYLEKD